MPNPAASPAVSSTVGLKNMVIAPLTVDTEETLTYGELQLVAGAIEASITPQNADPDVQYFDDLTIDITGIGNVVFADIFQHVLFPPETHRLGIRLLCIECITAILEIRGGSPVALLRENANEWS